MMIETVFMSIFVLWCMFIAICIIIYNHTDNEIYGFLMLISVPVMFYIPFLFIE